MTATATPDLLHELARHYGIATEFTDWLGNHQTIAPETLTAVLAALDVDASSTEAAEAALRDLTERHWRRVIPPTTTQRAGADVEVEVHAPAGTEPAVHVELETGERLPLGPLGAPVDSATVDGLELIAYRVRIPNTVPTGWHALVVEFAADALAEQAHETLHITTRRRRGEAPALEGRGTLICAPDRLAFEVPAPQWGLMTQLYQARSAASWGMGDLADLATIGEWGAERGADFVLVNPFHAPSPVTPLEPSPYLPTSRRFLDPTLLRIEDLVAAEPVTQEVGTRLSQLAQYCRQNHRRDVIDRDSTWLAKREALSLCFEAARRGDERRWHEFGEFCEREGDSLINFATWCALCEQHGGNWRDWPAEFQSPRTPEVDAFRQENAERVEFYCWVQWAIRDQGARTQQRLRDAGMRIGVIHDLAVGVHPSGADAWAMDESLARGVSVGAPPDQYNQLGQNWSQPPLRPDALERLGYAPFRDVLRAAFHGAGALRIDHILGLFRQWWVPAGMEADRGTYVTFNHEAMVSVLLLEAERAGALVIGEDLGTVSDLTREVMAERRVFGTQVMWFEIDGDTPKRPDDYRRECLATVTTHDLPPTAGFIELQHLHIRDQLGLITRPIDEERAEEQQLIDHFRDALEADGFAARDATTDELVLALHRRMARANSLLFGVALADLAGDRRPINQPGTYREYPNWTLPLTDPDGSVLLLEDVLQRQFANDLAKSSQRKQP